MWAKLRWWMFESNAIARARFCMTRWRVAYSEYDWIKNGGMTPHWEGPIMGRYRAEEMDSSEWIWDVFVSVFMDEDRMRSNVSAMKLFWLLYKL